MVAKSNSEITPGMFKIFLTEATTFTVVWFAGRVCKNRDRCYIYIYISS